MRAIKSPEDLTESSASKAKFRGHKTVEGMKIKRRNSTSKHLEGYRITTKVKISHSR